MVLGSLAYTMKWKITWGSKKRTGQNCRFFIVQEFVKYLFDMNGQITLHNSTVFKISPTSWFFKIGLIWIVHSKPFPGDLVSIFAWGASIDDSNSQ